MINFIKSLFKAKKKKLGLTLEEKLLIDGYVHLKTKDGKRVYAKNGHRVTV